MIRSNMEKHTLNWLVRQNKMKNLDFTISIQRKEVWDKEHKSNLIVSALLGVPIESLLFEEDGTGGYLVLDGKQRGTSLIQFIRGDYPISDNVKVKEINGVNIVGLYFNEFPDEFQELLKETELTISVLRPLSEDERETIFFMRNQAVSLTRVELTRVLLGGESMNKIQVLCGHQFIDKTNISRKKYLDQQIMMEILLLETGKDYGFSSKDMKVFAEEVKVEGISDEMIAKINNTLNYLDKSIPNKNRSLRKIHIPMVYMVAKEALAKDIQPSVFNEWVDKFFNDIKCEENEYIDACNNGSAIKNNVRKRLNYIKNHFAENIIH